MSNARFSLSEDTLKQIAADALAHAKALGASAADAEVNDGFGQGVTVRSREVETIEYTRDKSLGITVYLGQKRGSASTSDLTSKAIRDTVEAALTIARYTGEDDCAGLPDAHRHPVALPQLDLYHPWDVSVETAIEIASRCEAAALDFDPRITNSEGSNIYTQQWHFVHANSNGFVGGYPTSRYSLSCSVIGGQGDDMQRDDWYTAARREDELESAEAVGRRAAERTVRRLDARKLDTLQAPVLFDATLAGGLVGHFVGAVSGGALYRKSSFLLDSLGTQVFSPKVNLREAPHVPRGLSSAPFDDEGVATATRDVVTAGVVQGYFLGTYSARKLGMESTGNAGGSHNLVLESGTLDFDGLLRKMGRGLVVTELLGSGVNSVTGDYSRGAAGFWVEDGAIAYPVHEITIAGNLKEMFRGIVEIGTDVLKRGSKTTGSILIDHMTIAGN
ncbi:MAG: metalloprotease PmbA [Betaproteobacteria bacterium]|jgi:PmbA protein|nr:metalloprotease PmbA [Betaproteobacteria bacterium]